MEGVAFDKDTFHKALKYYTNKGALRACVGKTRFIKLTSERSSASIHINKFVPRAIRRIVPYTYFGILLHLPLETEFGADYYTTALTADLAHVGVKALITYDEWNPEHDQESN